jgi:hypothetical protein
MIVGSTDPTSPTHLYFNGNQTVRSRNAGETGQLKDYRHTKTCFGSARRAAENPDVENDQVGEALCPYGKSISRRRLFSSG